MKMNRNKIAPENNFQKSKSGWKGNKNSDRTNPKSDPFFVSKKDKFQKQETKNDSESFFVTKKEKSEILERKNNARDKTPNFKHNKFNKTDKYQGFDENKSSQFNKFKGGKVDKNANKKTFDKKKWRLQKYSKKYKLEQWEDKRKKAVLRGYYREIKDDQSKIDVQKIYEQYDSDEETNNKTEKSVKPPTDNKRRNYVQNPNYVPSENQNSDEDNDIIPNNQKSTNKKIFKGKPKNIAYKKAQTEFQRIKDERKMKQEEFLKKKTEREEALLEYKKKKSEKFKKLNKKTKKGQPIMKDRIEMLLEKIQSNK